MQLLVIIHGDTCLVYVDWCMGAVGKKQDNCLSYIIIVFGAFCHEWCIHSVPVKRLVCYLNITIMQYWVHKYQALYQARVLHFSIHLQRVVAILCILGPQYDVLTTVI